MKKLSLVIQAALILLLFLLFLTDPGTASSGAERGLLLWFTVLFPALFPFLLISRLFIQTNLAGLFSQVLYPFLGPLFGTSPHGSFCILIGFLCGYPMGAKTICDLYDSHNLDREQAYELLSFCNNASPGFITGFLCTSCLGEPALLPALLLILYGIPLFYAAVRTKIRRKSPGQPHLRTASLPDCSSQLASVDLNDAVHNSLGSIALIGGYVILFSILAAFLQTLPVLSAPAAAILCSLLEITSGAPLLCASFGQRQAFALLCVFSAFGGLSSVAQTNAFAKRSGLSIRSYIFHKFIQALLCGAAACLAIYLAY